MLVVSAGRPFTSTDDDGNGTPGRKDTPLEYPLRDFTWQNLISLDFLTDLRLGRWLAVFHEELVAWISLGKGNSTGKVVSLKIAGESA